MCVENKTLLQHKSFIVFIVFETPNVLFHEFTNT